MTYTTERIGMQGSTYNSPVRTLSNPVNLTIPYPPYFPLSGCPRPMLTSKYTLEGVTNRPAIEAVLELIRLSKKFPETKLPGSVVRQREIVAELEEEFQQSAVNQVCRSDLFWITVISSVLILSVRITEMNWYF